MKLRHFLSVMASVSITLLLSQQGLHAQTSIPNNTPIVQYFDAIVSTAAAALPLKWKMSSVGTGSIRIKGI